MFGDTFFEYWFVIACIWAFVYVIGVFSIIQLIDE